MTKASVNIKTRYTKSTCDVGHGAKVVRPIQIPLKISSATLCLTYIKLSWYNGSKLELSKLKMTSKK